MKKWEYLFVTADFPVGRGDRWLPRYVNDQELRDWKKGQTMSQYANALGDQG